jgi:hypothetical protein
MTCKEALYGCGTNGCREWFYSKYDLEMHRDHERHHQCPRCHELFVVSYYLNIHTCDDTKPLEATSMRIQRVGFTDPTDRFHIPYTIPPSLIQARKEYDERMYQMTKSLAARSSTHLPDLKDDYIMIDVPSEPVRMCVSKPAPSTGSPQTSAGRITECPKLEVARQLEAASRQRHSTNDNPV